MKLKKHSKFHHEVGTSAMSDIMFFLMLFFLIVSTVASPQVMQLLLPEANSANKMSKESINVTVNDLKEYSIGNRRVQFADLEGELAKEIVGLNDPTIVLRVSRELDVQSMVDVLEIGLRLRVKIVLQTSTRKE